MKKQSIKTFSLKLFTVGGMLLLLSTAFLGSSCNKNKTCHGKVYVTDTTGKVIGGAFVRLSATPVGGEVVYDATTDNSGVARFEVKLPAIFDVSSTKESAYPGKIGVGILRLDEPGKSAEVTVVIR